MTTITTNYLNEDKKMQEAILKSLHKARLVKEEKVILLYQYQILEN